MTNVDFDYSAISKNYFSPTQSKPFPLTVQRGNSLYNSTTKDGRYLFYATDQKGNFDIWFRDLQSSVVVPVTNHSFSETKPAISPNGKNLVFVSEEFDSEGDLILLSMDTEEWTHELLKGNRFIDDRFINLTNKPDKKGEYAKGIIDTDPTWSPDGSTIYFISDRFSPGLPNLCAMKLENPSQISAITSKGASSPYVSSDGNFIYFISYFEETKGEVYRIDLKTSEIQRITKNEFLDFSPTVDSKSKNLYYASIRKDTNKNGKLDERDNSILVMMNLTTGEERILSSGETSNFDVRYSNFNGGSILFSASYFNAINIYFIPENGAIPKQTNIREQYQYAKTFSGGQSLESYFLALDSVELFYSDDPLSPVYLARVAVLKYLSLIRVGKREEARLFLESYRQKASLEKNQFALTLIRWEESKQNGKKFDFVSEVHSHPSAKWTKDAEAMLYHLYADELEVEKKNNVAFDSLKFIYEKFPNYHQIDEIKRRLGGYEYKPNSLVLSVLYQEMIQGWENEKTRYLSNPSIPFSNNHKRDLRYLLEDVIQKVSENRNSESLILHVNALLADVEVNKISQYVNTLKYLKAKALSDVRKFSESNEVLDSIIPIPIQIDLEPPGKVSIFETPTFIAAYKSPILLRANLLKYYNQKAAGNTSDALRNLKIYLEFYDPILGVDLGAEDIQSAFFYFENKAVEFERIGDLLQSSFHYFFNNQNMFLVKTRNLYLDSLYKEYAIYYQRKMVDTIFLYGKKIREEEERALLSQLNILSKDKLNVVGNLSGLTSLVTDNELLRGVVDIKDFEKIEVLSEKALSWTELYYKQAVPRARPYLDLATLYGYSYYLINKYVTFESYYYATGTMTDVRKAEILENFKRAELELRWIIYADPTHYDAYQLLGWLYQYVDLIKMQKNPKSGEIDSEVYETLYKKYFPDKNLEANIELYNQILVFLGDDYGDQKVVSDLNLNLGNNYFLLSNFPKANESYRKVEDVSLYLSVKKQFEGYKQEAIYRFNYGKSLIYQGQYKKASEQFAKSIDIYFKNEYYQSVNAHASEPNSVTLGQLNGIRSKLALLFSLKGLSDLEFGNFEEAIVSFQTAIAYNKDVKYISPVNLANYLAIAFQKSGRFRDSYQMLNIAEMEYDSNKESILQRFKKWSWKDIFFGDSFRVKGDGRFPGEFPNDFKYLLTLGIRIENHIEQEEYSAALSEIKIRNDLITSKDLDDTIIGKNILAKSRQVEAQIYQRSQLQLEAVRHYNELAELLFENPLNKGFEKLFQNYAYSVFSLQESAEFNLDTKQTVLNQFIEKLDLWKDKNLSTCPEKDESCENEFRIANPKFDLVYGTTLYYSSLLLEENGKDFQSNLAKSVELLENPGLVDPRVVGLSADPISRQTRVRLGLNLYSIYMMLGDIPMAEKKWKETSELAYEFRLDEEMFWANAQRFKWEKSRRGHERSSTYSSYGKEAIQTYQNNLAVRLFSPKHRLVDFLETYSEAQLESLELKGLVNHWENFRSLELFRDLVSAQFEFEDSKLNLYYQDLIKWVKGYRKLTQSISEKTLKRESVTNVLKQQTNEIQNLDGILNKLKVVSPERSTFLEPTRTAVDHFPNGWMGLFPSNQAVHLLYSSQGKLRKETCEQKAEIRLCLPKITDPSPSLQIIGKKVNGSLVKSVLDGYRSSDIFPVLLFDRTHNELFSERNERRLKWVTVYGDLKNDKKETNLRHLPSGNLGIYLYDTDYLVTNRPLENQTSLFGDENSYILPLREIFQGNGSEISVIGLNESNFNTSKQWNLLSKLYEVLRSKRIQNMVSYPVNIHEDYSSLRLSKFAKDKNRFLIGNWKEFSISKDGLGKKAEELMESGFLKEKSKEFVDAYESYYTASTLLDDDDPSLPSLELKLAKLKTEIFPNVQRRSIFKPLWTKYTNSNFQNQIRYEYLVSCLSSKDKEDCKYNSSDFIGEEKDSYLGALSFYFQLRSGKVGDLNSKNELRSKVEIKEDPFLQAYRLGTLYIQNYMFYEAESETNKLSKLAKTPKEKTVVKNRFLELYFHKGFLFGDQDIYLTALTSTSAYNYGFKKDWKNFDEKILSRDFTKFGYADSIYDSYRLRLYSAWKEQIQTGFFEPMSLTPEYLTSGDSVITKLSHLNKTLLFHLLLSSIPFQKNQEVNSLIELLVTEELKEGRNYRTLFFRMELAKALLLRGELEMAESLVTKIQTMNKELGEGNRYWQEKWSDFKWKLEYLKNQSSNSSHSSPFLKLFQTAKSKKPEDFISLLNDFNKKYRAEYLSPELKEEYEFLFHFLLQQSLEKNSSESFFDLAVAREIFRFTSERFSNTEMYVRHIPNFEVYSERLKKKMVGKQEFHGLFDLGKKTYLLSFASGKSLGREMFSDNKSIYRESVRYFRSSESGNQEVILRESLADKYRTSFRLNKSNRHYIYSAGIHSVIPMVLPDTEHYAVSSVSDFLSNPSIKFSSIAPKKPDVSVTGWKSSLENEINAGLLVWETNGKKEGYAPYSVNYAEIGWCQNNSLCIGDRPLLSVSGKIENTATLYVNQKIGTSAQYTNDFSGVAYYLGRENSGLFVLHSGIQTGVHNLFFLKQFLQIDDLPKPLHVRLVEGKEAARNSAIDDRFWIGYKLYTSAMIED
ncbi:biopolymer transporter TolR [Leptospira congkakensis]|uniref:Biopolymer transporter TolR n=2 Tax=Leptospira congkakensis TaxID=2484932 RepID=A0A4Z1AGX1_9LEPT|nr:PD40 domain-containing protein [Leptospira congkakensis]TGL87967.1 biopolymer transporter TolR [Leptospira congkakensis]TGL92726.1 biopolymer transporter TolR [Leptospira congkakensis]TGL95943.1 biopolymer transporter TolR [Leptospira congkakensis]